MNIQAIIMLIAVAFFVFVLIIVGIFVAFVKKKEFVHNFYLFDSYKIINHYKARLIDDNNPAKTPTFYLVKANSAWIKYVLAFFGKKCIIYQKPSDKYVYRSPNYIFNVIGSIDDENITPMEVDWNGITQKPILDEEQRRVSTVTALRNTEKFIGGNLMQMIGSVMLVLFFIMGIIGFVLVSSFYDGQTQKAVNLMEKQNDAYLHIAEVINKYGSETTQIIKILAQREGIYINPDAPPEVVP